MEPHKTAIVVLCFNIMRRSILIISITVLALAAIAVYVLLTSRSRADRLSHPEGTSPKITEHFKSRMEQAVIAQIGQPIEGFNAHLYLQTFPGLTPSDFEGVTTGEGIYTLKENEVVFVRTRTDLITSAEGAIDREGMTTLLANVSNRLDVKLEDTNSVDTILVKISQKKVPERNSDSGAMTGGLGETIVLAGSIRITPLEIVEDSRCPEKAVCVWEGRLRVRIRIESSENSATTAIATLGERLRLGGSMFMLAQATRAPQYRFTWSSENVRK